MKPKNAFPHDRPLIEPLEQRIAPALLVTGANLLGGAGNPTTGTGSVGGNSATLVTVISGEAIVWYDHGVIDAISVGPNTSLNIVGDVGAIVGNLTASGQLSNSSLSAANGLNGDVLLPNNITGITTHRLGDELGSIGNIITGGSVSNLNISGDLSGVYAGTGAFYTGNSNPLLDSHVFSGGRVTVTLGADPGLDVNPIMPGVQNSFVFPASNAKTVLSGASISNVKVADAKELQVLAGAGFAGTAASPGHAATPGMPGGSISNITIENAFVDVGLSAGTPSYDIMAGSGGNGTKGGAGGSILKINEISSSGIVDILAGQGGNGTGGAGGAGGSILGLNMQSDGSAYTVLAGSGGTGSPGGAGGSVKGVNFGGNALSSGIVVAAHFTGGSGEDILLVDSLTGNMVIEQNVGGNGGGFVPVVQDSISGLETIAPVGSSPVSAVAVDLGTGHGIDFVVAYKGSDQLGVYTNQGGGVFYVKDYSNSTYTGDTLEATSVSLPYAPLAIASGNFTGDGSQDIAVVMANGVNSELMTLAGNGAGQLSVPTVMVQLPAGATSLVTANIQGGAYSDLFAGFASGQIDSLLSTGSTSGAPFTAVPSGITISGGFANLDYNNPDNLPSDGLLLALNTTGDNITLYQATSSGLLIQDYDIPLSQADGTALVAHFVPDSGTIAAPIQVLSSTSSGSSLTTWAVEDSAYTITSTVNSTEALRNFVPVLGGTSNGVAAVGGSFEHFAFSQNGGAFYDVGLPFSGKQVVIHAGDGGDGINAATNIAAGGAGGEVYGMNIFAGDITVSAGNGGASINAPAGAGGLVGNGPALVTVTGQTLAAALDADYILSIDAGTGGAAGGSAHAAVGGAGGGVQGLNLSILAGDIDVASGDGGAGSGGAGGNAGMVDAIKAVSYGGELSVISGNGGAAGGAVGNGGSGGSIMNVTYSLAPTDLATEVGYNVGLTAGFGGSSASAAGGAGGAVEFINLTLQPANESVTDGSASPATTHANIDSTVRVEIAAGYGGAGATGGAGGALKSISSTSVFDQSVVLLGATAKDTTTFAEVNPVTAQLTSGHGGAGTRGAGGAGGAITALNLVGISHYDPDPADPQAGDVPLAITSGYGGNGSTIGGAGGAITGVVAENAIFNVVSSGGAGSIDYLNGTELSAASVVSGNGGAGGTGAGGAGGTISGLNIGVSGFYQAGALTYGGGDGGFDQGGQLTVQSGAGGAGGTAGKGGAGGNITSSFVGCADAYEDYGLLLHAGAGANGALGGGAGGSVTNIQLNAPQNPTQIESSPAYDILSTLILAGNGGAATGAAAVGGAGGSISQIVQSKDVNSAINVIQAGNGGGAAGTGGLGGSVTSVKVAGLIGQASDDAGNSFGVFQTYAAPGAFTSLFPYGYVPQGVFAGRGGFGATHGLAGSVTSISAAQIAAIGAAVDSSGLFAAAEKVANITAESIAYNITGGSTYDNGSTQNPAQAVATDGFIFSETAPTGIVTADNALLEAFTFVV